MCNIPCEEFGDVVNPAAGGLGRCYHTHSLRSVSFLGELHSIEMQKLDKQTNMQVAAPAHTHTGFQSFQPPVIERQRVHLFSC